MKKHYFLLLTVAASSLMANAFTYQLASIKSEIVPDHTEYYYDDTNCRIDSMTDYYVSDIEYLTSSKYFYDDNGNEVRQKGYQKKLGNDFYTHINDIYYTYDDQNRITSRTNYNLDPFELDEFMLGGVYVYEYEGDKLIKKSLYWDVERTNLSEEITYEYDDQGRLASETSYSISFFSGEKEFSWGKLYKYDEDGKLTDVIYQILDYNTYQPMEYGGEAYTYDDAGNITMWIKYSRTPDNPSQKEIYEYDTDMQSADILFPVTQEWDGRVYTTSTNALVKQTIYASDFNTGELGLYDILDMSYTPFTGAGVAKMAQKQQAMQVFYSADGTLHISGLQGNEPVRIYNSAGLMMNQSNYTPGEGIDISSLPAGAYIIATDNGSAKIIKR